MGKTSITRFESGILNNFKSDLFLYLAKDEKNLLEKLSDEREGERERFLLKGVINRYSMPVIGE